jgi:O-acetyl-ADP-ribose deacetylase (regulator of RNase III)
VIHVVVDDLASVESDAVVRPATDKLEPTSPSLRQLERIGGPRFHQQLETRAPLVVGAATVTSGGDLPSEFVIHAVIRSVSEAVSRTGVQRALISALQQATAWQFRAVAIPPIGIGPGNLALEDAAEIICDVLHSHLPAQGFPSEVTIVVETEEDKTVFENLLRRREQ